MYILGVLLDGCILHCGNVVWLTVFGVLRDFHLLDLLSEGGTVSANFVSLMSQKLYRGVGESGRRLKGGGEICDLRTWYRIYRSRRPLKQLLAMEHC